MSKDTILFNREKLDELEKQLEYMVHGQGFTVFVIDTKHTRRRTLANMLHKIGIEKVIDAENYVKAVNALHGREEDVNIILCIMELDKVNGIKFLTDYIRKAPKSRGVILVDEVAPKLQQIVDMSKLLELLKRPFQEDELREVIKKFGVPF